MDKNHYEINTMPKIIDKVAKDNNNDVLNEIVNWLDSDDGKEFIEIIK